MIAALYVQTGGVYYGLPDVDPWDEKRDARQYAGPWPVVAHPPCSTWCQLAKVNEARYGVAVGSDGGCFKAALSAVQTWGGVLEHPAYSHAWSRFGLTRPIRGGWLRCMWSANDGKFRSWVAEVSQSAYGHEARKRTWLYFVGPGRPPAMDWRDVDGTAWVGNDGSANAKRALSKAEAKRTPLAFRDVLLNMARSVRRTEAA